MIALILMYAFHIQSYAKDMRCSVKEIRTNVCWALCRQDGADTGWYEEKNSACICGFRKEYKEITQVVIRVKTHSSQEEP